ncbi:hypothetical protein CXG81DRAFT_13543, partial [Caulochytrium protostelioides]
MRFCVQLVRNMKRSNKDALPFLRPVDPILQGVPHYPTMIPYPMDISTLDAKLAHHLYTSPDEFAKDVELMFENCYRFNGRDAAISQCAMGLERIFRKGIDKMPRVPRQTNGHSYPSRMRREASSPAPSSPTGHALAGAPAHPPRDPMLKFCHSLLTNLLKKQHRAYTFPFLYPVDTTLYPAYAHVVLEPVDLSTIKIRLERGIYEN